MFQKVMSKLKERSESVEEVQLHHAVKAHKIGNATLTLTTIALVIVSLHFGMQFAPFIILLMSSRIGASIYTVMKTASKRELGKLVVWCALFAKSVSTCCHFFALSL